MLDLALALERIRVRHLAVVKYRKLSAGYVCHTEPPVVHLYNHDNQAALISERRESHSKVQMTRVMWPICLLLAVAWRSLGPSLSINRRATAWINLAARAPRGGSLARRLVLGERDA